MTKTPYITASKLVEYVFASPQRRTKIIENALTPPLYILDTKYPDIERATAAFLHSFCKDDTRLTDLDTALLRRDYSTNHEESRILNAHDAIEYVKITDWRIPADVTIELPVNCPKGFEISGLQVGINPTNLLKRLQSGQRYPAIGVAKPYFSKTNPLSSKGNREGGVLFATLLHWYTESTLSNVGMAEQNLCLVGDVFAQQVHFAARNYKQRRKQLEASALEIADRWETIRSRLGTKAADKIAR